MGLSLADDVNVIESLQGVGVPDVDELLVPGDEGPIAFILTWEVERLT